MAYTTINKSADHFNLKKYTGTGSNGNAVTGIGFQPNLIWIKDTVNAYSHRLYDSTRGVNSAISTDNNSGASQYSAYGQLESIDSDGFTVGQGSSSGAAMNDSGDEHISFCWKAGSSTSSNSDGDVTSTVSVNSTAGFSIVKWTNSGNAGWVGHGLGTVPHWILIKSLDSSASSITAWVNYHHKINTSSPEDYTSYLNGTDARIDNPVFNDTAPTSTKFRFDSGDTTDYIAYCFAEKKGYSKMGRYIGSGSSTQSFIYTGFRPRFIIVKCLSESDDWFMHDDLRDGYNDDNEWLFPSSSSAEGTNVNRIRLLSNGFQVPTTDKSHNKSGNEYMYIAFGQSIVGSNNVPATAR